MHPSSCRSGKQIQALLGEATQSHQVKRKFHASGGENLSAKPDEAEGTKSIFSFFGGKTSEDKDKQKDDVKDVEKEISGNLKDSNRAKIGGEMSLILFEQVR